MAGDTIYFRGTRQDAKRAIRRTAAMVTGRESDVLNVKRGVALAVGMSALSDIKEAFVVKADGGTGEDGIKWKPLSPAYLAYGRRFGTREQTGLKKASGLGRQHRHGIGANTGLLTKDEKREWQSIFASRLQRFLLTMPPAMAKAKAAAIAWTIMKNRGAQTKLNVFGHRKVQMLRDTGVLLNSLSPGIMSDLGPDAVYQKPSDEGGDKQIFDVLDHGVIVGTNVAYAAAHQYGSKKQGIPARPFLPEPKNIPALWWKGWANAANKAMAAGIKLMLQVNQ
jgi:hypothetical protein